MPKRRRSTHHKRYRVHRRRARTTAVTHHRRHRRHHALSDAPRRYRARRGGGGGGGFLSYLLPPEPWAYPFAFVGGAGYPAVTALIRKFSTPAPSTTNPVPEPWLGGGVAKGISSFLIFLVGNITGRMFPALRGKADALGYGAVGAFAADVADTWGWYDKMGLSDYMSDPDRRGVRDYIADDVPTDHVKVQLGNGKTLIMPAQRAASRGVHDYMVADPRTYTHANAGTSFGSFGSF